MKVWWIEVSVVQIRHFRGRKRKKKRMFKIHKLSSDHLKESFPCLQVSLCVLLLRYQPEGDIHGFVNFLSEEQNKTKRKEGVLAECEKDACSPTSEADEYGGPPTNTCGAKNLPSLGDNEMLIGKPDKNAYTASHPNYGTVDLTTGIEAEESESGMSRRLKKLIGPRYYTLRIRLGLPGKMDRPTPATGKTVTVCVLLLFIFLFAFCSFIIFGEITIQQFQTETYSAN